MVFDNKMVNKMAQDALVCAPNLEQDAPWIYNRVKVWTKSHYLVDKARIQSTFRFMKMCLFLNKVISYGLGYIYKEDLHQAFRAWSKEDRRYYCNGDLEVTCEGMYYMGMHPALNHRRQLPMY